jgi:hypothetical protein
MAFSKKPQPGEPASGRQPRRLTAQQVQQINELLAALGEYGEIHLIVQRGELKYINKVESQRAWTDDDQENL